MGKRSRTANNYRILYLFVWYLIRIINYYLIDIFRPLQKQFLFYFGLPFLLFFSRQAYQNFDKQFAEYHKNGDKMRIRHRNAKEN